MRVLLSILAIFLLNGLVQAQLSKEAKVYLLTCEVGDEVYSQFGHSALRISDPAAPMDICANWGMFNPGNDEFQFMMEFARGKLDYFMAIQETNYFLGEYYRDKREVRQLELNLTLHQKNELYAMIIENYKPENRTYKYDFFFDNCATRIYHFIEDLLGSNLIITEHPNADQFTYRESIDVGFASHPWTDFGIDLVLGAPIDGVMNTTDMMYNPFFMEHVFFHSYVLREDGSTEKLVTSEPTVIVQGKTRPAKSDSFFTPVFMMSLFLVITVLLGGLKYVTALKIWGGFLLFLSGILGIIILVMWFFTDHQAAAYNWNLLWANPVMLFFLFYIFKEDRCKRLNKTYLYFMISMIAIVFFFLFIPQEYHPASRLFVLNLVALFFYWFKQTQTERPDKVNIIA